MRKAKRLMSKVAAFTMATMMTATGCLSGFSPYLSGFGGNTNAFAATVTGTNDADKFSWDNATVYFLLTDRFKNGNTANDHSYNRGLDKNGNVITGVDDRGTFHGGDFAGVTQAIEEGYFNDLGVNALWISAAYEQIHGYIVGGDGSPSFAHYSYHGYYVLDYTQTDANFGTEEEFKTLVDTAHKHGLRVVMDVVMNHAGYNSLYDMNEYGFGTIKTGWDDYYYPMANVNNKDYHSYIDYETSAADWSKWWGPDWIRCGVAGYTPGGNSPLTQCLAGLPDFYTEKTGTVGIPKILETKWKQEGRYDEEVNKLNTYLTSHGYSRTVTNCISYWLSSWVREYGVDGFRCDTAKHVDLSSWKTLKTMCTEALREWKAANPDKALDDLDFWMTGECWDHGVSYDDYYTVGGFDSMINFDTTGGGVLSLGTVAGKYNDYAKAINTNDNFNVLSYMSSHDSTLARGDQKYLGSALLLLPGGVQIYYGDETNRPLVSGMDFDGNGGAGHSLRSDMNWDTMDEDVLSHWQKVGTFRNNHIAVGAGSNTTVNATSGVGFVRTYSKGTVTDRVAACIGATANTQVTLDVSTAWNAGDMVVNYYDGSSATVASDGTVTFSSGANGTILIGDPDGKPLVSVKGEAKFKGTQQVTISIEGADSAIVSIDGGKKFIAKNGDKFTIGETAYEGDTVTVSCKATNEKGTTNSKATFYKAYADEDISGGGGDEELVKGKVRVKMSDGSAPYLYAWEGSNTELAGAWPGTLLTQKDSEGYYYCDLDTTGTYNVIFNNGSETKTNDIKGLKGETTFEVVSGFASYEQTGGTVVDNPIKNTITIRIKPYSSSSAPYLYVWNDSATYNGGFPGKQLTEKDENGNYIFVIEGAASVNCIVSGGSNQSQSGNITGITGEAIITLNSADYSQYDVVKTEKAESKFELMKKEARAIKNMIPSDYTTASWNALYAFVADADRLVALGEEGADADAVTTMYNNIIAAKEALVLVAPKVTKASTGSKTVTGVAPCEATVTAVIGGKSYTAQADEVTGIWTVTAASNLTSSSTIITACTRSGLKSQSATVSLANGNIDEPVDDPGTELSATLKVNGSTGTLSLTKGGSVNLVPIATGGSGSYTYQYVMKIGTSSVVLKDYSTATSYTGPLTSVGTKVFAVNVKDSTGKVVATNSVTVVVSSGTQSLSATLKVNGSTGTINLTKGGSVTLVPTATGGSGSYTYQYLMKTSATGSNMVLKNYSSATSYTGPLTSAGTKIFTVNVKDSTGTVVATNSVTVVVSNPQSLSANLKVNGSTGTLNLTKGGSVTLVPAVSGGSGTYTYQYLMKTSASGSYMTLKNYSSATSYTGPLTSAGTKIFTVNVKDSTGTVVATNSVTVVVSNPQSLSANLKVNGSTGTLNLTKGGSVTLVPAVSGGSGTYTYQYLMKTSASGSYMTLKSYSSATSYTGPLTSAGTKIFVVNVKDSAGTVVSSNTVTVVVK